MISIVSGFIAGFLHVLSGPDHLAAIAPLSVRSRHRTWLIGLRWGLGHCVGVLLIGLLSLWLRELLPLEALSSWAEIVVGIVLVGIGVMGIGKALTHHVHAHEHTHDGLTHWHFHIHGHKTAHAEERTEGRLPKGRTPNGPQTAHGHEEAQAHHHTHAGFAIGALHGLAGSSHFFGVLPALAFPHTSWAVCYVAAFGAGTILAMISFSSIIGFVARSLAGQGTRAYRVCLFACSSLAVMIGAWWLF